jgi:DNA-binding transcriptional regulator YdaS (Cro superfamily)
MELKSNDKPRGIDKVIGIVGSAQILAARLGVSHQAVYAWRKAGAVPVDRALQIEKMFGVQREELVSQRLLRLLT